MSSNYLRKMPISILDSWAFCYLSIAGLKITRFHCVTGIVFDYEALIEMAQI